MENRYNSKKIPMFFGITVYQYVLKMICYGPMEVPLQ